MTKPRETAHTALQVLFSDFLQRELFLRGQSVPETEQPFVSSLRCDDGAYAFRQSFPTPRTVNQRDAALPPSGTELCEQAVLRQERDILRDQKILRQKTLSSFFRALPLSPLPYDAA